MTLIRNRLLKVKRELRGLRDVEIVNIGEGPEEYLKSWGNGWDSVRFELVIIAMKYKPTNITAISYTILERFNCANISAEIRNVHGGLEPLRIHLEQFELSLSEEQKNAISALTFGLYHRIEDSMVGLMLVGKDSLEEMCKKIVVNFDIEVLEKAREER